MNRKEFLRLSSLTGLSPLLIGKSHLLNLEDPDHGSCVLVPSETAGPFPLDLSANTYYFRKDIRENKTGTLLNLKLRIIGLDNCLPMPNVRVNIWHCDKDGLYSGYNQNNNPGQDAFTYLRGYQFTDANGEVDFITILPGWYTGRICHIHFQVYLSSSYSAISQLTFPIAVKNAVYAENKTLYTKGSDPLSFAQDNIFSDGYQYQLATLEPGQEPNVYSSFLEVAVKGSGLTATGHLEKETEKQFTLHQNFPNPFIQSAEIQFDLKHASSVKLELWNLEGKKVSVLIDESLNSGKHSVEINLRKLNLPPSNYAYQLIVENQYGRFTDVKLMTHSNP